MAGMKIVVDDASHRQEVVAGNMSEYLANGRWFFFSRSNVVMNVCRIP